MIYQERRNCRYRLILLIDIFIFLVVTAVCLFFIKVLQQQLFIMANNLSPIPLTKYCELNTDNRNRGRERITVIKFRMDNEAGPKISQNVNYTQRGTMERPKAPSEARRREAPRVWGLERGAVDPPQYGGLAALPPENFEI